MSANKDDYCHAHEATAEQIDGVVKKVREQGLEVNISRGTERTVVGAIGDERRLDQVLIESLPGVEQALHILKPYKAAGADGLLVEMHPNPCDAWCDADQALNPQELIKLMGELRGIASVIGREIL